jgi:penicillin amidase
MKILRRIGIAVILVIILLVIGIYIFVRSTLPDYEGSYSIAGIEGNIEVMRDTYGIPHIFAGTKNDLVFGLGYSMAQDRLWQMDILRRVSRGRLSELFGEIALDADRFSRVLGFGRGAKKTEENLTAGEKEYLGSFLNGINHYIKFKKSELPVEFRMLGYVPEPFTIHDILAVTMYQSFLNSHNWKFELARLSAKSLLGDKKGSELFPPLTYHGPYMSLPGNHAEGEGLPQKKDSSIGKVKTNLIPSPRMITELLKADALLASYSGLNSMMVHSNGWVVSGTRTKSGKPILANDYHMPLLLPSLWYEAHLCGGGIDVIGVTLPGMPTIIAGHNRHIAWGATTTGGDIQDIYIEKVNPSNGNEYLFKGKYEPFKVVSERIYYKAGKDKKYIDVNVLISRHGPILNSITKVSIKDGPPLALKTVDGAMKGLFTFSTEIMEAKNWSSFKKALSHYNAFIWNWVYADKEGNIGFRVSGMIPIRKKGTGLEPVPGWDGEHEWKGVIPFEELPELYNPKAGYIVTANNEISDERYPYMIQSSAFVLPYRAMRIEELIKSLGPATYESMREIQADTDSRFGLTIAGLVINAVKSLKVQDERTIELARYLQEWNGSSDVENVGMTIAFEVFARAMDNLFANKLDAQLYQVFKEQMYYSSGVCLLMLQDGTYSNWYDDPVTKKLEGRDEILIKSLKDADRELTAYFGKDISKWKWGKVHTYTFNHTLGSIAPFKWIWNIGPFAFPGDISTVRPGFFTDISKKPYKVTDGSSMRHVIDFADFDNAKFVISTGESERWLSPHYDDQTRMWMDVKYITMGMNREDIRKNMKAKLVFIPDRPLKNMK